MYKSNIKEVVGNKYHSWLYLCFFVIGCHVSTHVLKYIYTWLWATIWISQSKRHYVLLTLYIESSIDELAICTMSTPAIPGIHILFMMYDVYWYCQMKKNEWLWKFWKRNDWYENHATVELYMTFIKSCVVLNIVIKIKILDYRIESKW
jgi:hypothetical protein